MSQSSDFYSQSIEDVVEELEISLPPPERRSKDPTILKVDFKGMPREIINAIRRGIFDAVPSMAIEHMFMHRNGSNIILDNFEHGMGGVPIFVDPDMFLYPHELERLTAGKGTIGGFSDWTQPHMTSLQDLTELTGYGVPHEPGQLPDGTNLSHLPPPMDERAALCFELDVECTFDQEKKQLRHNKVFGSDVVWKPLGNQRERFEQLGLPVPCLQPDVLLAQLYPGQKMKWTMYAIKGCGAKHVKWRGGNAFFNPVGDNEYQLQVTSTNGLDPSFHLLSALSYLSQRFKQLARDCACTREGV